jgi:peroxiredoxin Q/BCP
MARKKAKKKTKKKAKTKTKKKLKKKTKVSKKKSSKTKAKKKAKKKVKAKKSPTKKAKKRPSLKSPYAAQTKSRISSTSQLKSFGKTAEHKIKVGDKAPDFTLLNHEGKLVSLEDFRGQNFLLYFYPRDNTPGCTKEACSFKENLSKFNNLETQILGVSFDDQQSHQKFISKYKLNFQLLSDLNKEVAQAYGCYVKKNMYGNIKWGIQRSTFIIDTQGRIAAVFPKVKVDGHTQEVLAALSSINKLQASS